MAIIIIMMIVIAIATTMATAAVSRGQWQPTAASDSGSQPWPRLWP